MTLFEEKLTGIFPPVATPFHSGLGPVAYDRLEENITFYNGTQLRGYMPLGSNGEFRSLSDTESERVIDTVARARSEDKVIIAGAGRESAYGAIEFIKRIAGVGIDFASLLPPFYFLGSMDDDALMRYYVAVADASPVPVMVYNAPKFAAGLTIEPRVIARLAVHPNIVGMKDTSSEDIRGYIDAVPEGAEFHVLAGSVNKLYEGLLSGCTGGVLSMADYLPVQCCRLLDLGREGDTTEGRSLDDSVRRVSNAVGKYGIPGVKAAMDILGLYGGPPRNPLRRLDARETAEIKKALAAEGYPKRSV